MARRRMRTRRLFGLTGGDNDGRPLGSGLDNGAPTATVFPDAGGPGDGILPDGIGGGGHGDVGATPITRIVVAEMAVMRRGGGVVPRSRNDMDIGAIEGAVSAGCSRHGRHRHACRVVSRGRPPPGMAWAVGHG